MQGDNRETGRGSLARLAIRFLGSVEVILDGRPLRAFDAVRLQRILAQIALKRIPLHRSRLAFELWPDSEERQARTNLRKLLHELRQALPDVGEFIEIGSETVRWLSTSSAEVDALRFRDALSSGDLELAARLYSGDFLPACYDDWVLEERAKLRAEALDAISQLAETAASRDEFEATIRHTQRIIDMEPTAEAAVQMQMEAHLAVGDRSAALRAYHRCAEALERDLAVAPRAAIQSMYSQLRTDTGDRGDDPRRNPETPEAASFVGRDIECSQLIEVWNKAKAGRALLAIVTGEPGVGKTRLASELGRRARLDGHLTASSRAYEAAGRPPWGPVVDLLRSEALRSGVDTLDPAWRTELARLLPEHAHESQPTERIQSSDGTERLRLFNAVSQAIVAGDRPRLLIIDDLQWCDNETIELIGFALRHAEKEPLLIIGTVRPEEVSPDHPLANLLEVLERDRVVTTVPLERLDKDATVMLAARLSSEDTMDPELAARLWSETEGNPLFIIEAMRAGISTSGSQAVLTPTMRAVLGARLSQLAEDTRRIAELAAVVGRSFSIRLIAAAAKIDEGDLVDHIDELWRRRLIRDQGQTYDFSHDKLRAVALEMITPARRRQLHRSVAEAIAQEFQEDLGAASPQLAAHYDQAGMIEEALNAYRAAGARAAAVSALQEALAMFRKALALLADMRPSPERDELEIEIRIALGSPLVALKGYGSADSHQLYERALSLCRKLNRSVAPPILRGLGLARLQGCRFADCEELALELADHDPSDPLARTEGEYLLGVSAFWRGDLAESKRHLEGAIAAYDLSHRDEHLASYAQDPKAVCLIRLAWVELWSGDLGEADRIARSALAIANDIDHPMTLAYVATYAAIIAAESEDINRLSEILEYAERLWARIDEHYLVVVLDALRGWRDVDEGSAEGIERIMQSVVKSRAEGETLHLTYALLLLARARGKIGESRAGSAAAQEGLSWTRKRGQGYLEPELWRVGGEIAYTMGDTSSAAASLDRAIEIAASQGASWLELRALQSFVSRVPDPDREKRRQDLLRTIPSGRDCPAFRSDIGIFSKKS